MQDNQPYKYWTREQLFFHCEKQCVDHGQEQMVKTVKDIIFDSRWNPKKDYNGCNVVQDKYLPYVPCLIHDYRWLVEKGGIDSDIEFRLNLKKFGTKEKRSVLMFIGVRLGWFFYYKWAKMIKRNKGKK